MNEGHCQGLLDKPLCVCVCVARRVITPCGVVLSVLRHICGLRDGLLWNRSLLRS